MSGRWRKSWRGLRDPLGACAARGALVLFRHVPAGALSRFGAGMGAAAFPLLRRERRRALANLDLVFGARLSPREKRRIARETFKTFGRGVLECMAYAFMKPEERAALVKVEGQEHLDKALAGGRGVIALTGHFGNFMIMGPRLADAGYADVNLVVKAAKDRHVETVLQQQRDSMGIRTILFHPRVTCTRLCLQALKRNGILILLADQHFRRGGVAADFLGHPCTVAPGAASLALATGAAVLPMFMIRGSDGRHRLVIDPPVELVRLPGRDAAVAANTQRFTDIIAAAVLRHPDHWSWMHRRGRQAPAGQP